MKHYSIVPVFFIIAFNVYALDSFSMKELTVTEWVQNDHLFNRISNELISYINIYYEYRKIENLEHDNFEYIYEFSKFDFEKIFFVVYTDISLFSREYFVVFIVTSNNGTEIQKIEISVIDRILYPPEFYLPFSIPTLIRESSNDMQSCQVTK
jgi:hypothetical protein